MERYHRITDSTLNTFPVFFCDRYRLVYVPQQLELQCLLPLSSTTDGHCIFQDGRKVGTAAATPISGQPSSVRASAHSGTTCTNSTTRALPASVYPGGKPQVPDPAVTKPAPTKGSRAPADKGGLPCVTPKSRKDGLVSQCLIAIVTLAGVATVFIVSTTVLCTKLSARKYRYRMRQSSGTEMTCISALLPDGNGAHGRPRTPKSNGALLPNLEDGEGDDLTLHSFLPEMERGS
ncbi:hypothetical protein COCON_G00161180 [Conger conger]|uniref:Uncharacterized protein n=1 Tax=Conger conger TaxID=82655 RepID=A0A9Q1DA84_CONCO|nr:hypothetical protein COCON_G00161180 [Conger conger]